MLVARIDRPAAQLDLAGASNLPQIEQSTILRIILPLASRRPVDGPDSQPTEPTRGSSPRQAGRDEMMTVSSRPSVRPDPPPATSTYPPRSKARDMIETRDLTKMYGDLYALEPADAASWSKGDVYGFIGPNGAGKTTTMRILATLLNPTWGEATRVRLLDLQRRQGDPPRRSATCPTSSASTTT